MKLIDGNQLETGLTIAIQLQTAVAEALELMDDPEVKKEIKTYNALLQDVKNQPGIPAIPIEWIRQQAAGYPGMESAMWDKLIRIWEDRKND